MTRTNQPTQVPALPKLPADTPPALRRYLELLEQTTNIRLGRRGDPRDRAITLRELISSGLAKELKEKPFDPNTADAGFVSSDTGLTDLAVPPAPTGFSVTGAFSIINMSWNNPGYSNHSHTEVYVHTSDSLGSATLLGITGSRVFSDPVGSGQNRYYWIRHVNTSGLPGPYNSGTGTLGQTATDVTHMLTLLSGAITSSQLASRLSTPIADIPNIQTNITTINNNITALDNFTGFSSSYSGDSLLTRMGAVETTANGAATSAQLQSEQTTRANADTALASDITTLQSSVSTNAAAIQTEQTARANADSAIASDVTSLTTTVGNNAAAISAETTARSNADSALASDITSLNTATSNNAAAISSETTARTNADSAIANDVSTLTTTVSGNTSSISTQATSINGLEAQYTVKIDNNGAISGYGLASNAVDGSIVSEFIVNADRFAIISPSTTLTNPSGSHNASVPFTVQATQTTLNGETVPAGVYMTDAFIKNGSIVSAKIGSLAVDKISGTFAELGTVLTGFLDGDKIEANSLDAGRITTDTLNVAGKSITDSIGRISGTSGQNESDNGQDITITELVRSIYGANGKPKHIVGATSSSHSPSVSIGDVLGGSPRFSHNFTTFNFTGNRDFIIQVGLDFTGSTSSTSESIFAVAMRATRSSSNFTSSTESDYVFTEKISSSGSHAVGFHALNAKVQLNPNTEYYIWCFALGDDGVTSYKSGFISVFGLNK